MSPWKYHGRGTPVLRMSFRGIGQIERATGFQDAAMLGRLKEMCHTLYEAGKDELLRDIREGRITLREVWAIYRTGQWQRLPSAQHALPFQRTYKDWWATKPSAYARFARWAMNALAPAPETLGELRPSLLRYRAASEAAQRGAMFNRVFATMRAFLRDTVTTDHPLYHDVASVEGLPEAVKRPKRPQDPKRALAIREMLGGEIGESWWALCCTGMLPDEFFSGKWAVEDGRVHVKGTKREARDRFVPLLTELRPSAMTKQRFERALRESGLGVRPKDGRDSFALWCDLAGIPQGWKRALMGHQAENVTQEYGWQESERVLNEAETKLRKLLACQNNTRQTGGHSTRESRKSNAPRRTRTPSLLIRSQALYPVELWALGW
jgi:hypothetical protein